MPLLVQCPRGCQVKMPRSRAGRVVRCPECKCAMRVPVLTEAQLSMGKVIPCRAKLARRRKLDPVEAAQREKESREKELKEKEALLQSQQKSATDAEPDFDSGPIKTLEETQVADASDAAPVVPVEVTADEESHVKEADVGSPAPPHEDLLDLPDPGIPEPPKPRPPKLRKAVPPATPALLLSPTTGLTPFINLEEPSPVVEQDKDWEERLSVANQDRILFARFFAICLCLVAVLNVIPASLQWYHWTQLSDSAPLPRWIYIQLFIGAIYLIYAFFLAQIPDWSALRAVSVAMLLMAFVFGIISTGLLVGGHGDFSGHLGIPFALNRQACIWCVAMLCVATLMSFWGGKESANWQRAEQILHNIVGKTV